MLILGIETSCDDTAAAVLEDGFIVRSSIVASQDVIHAKYGGIVPELASRSHIESIIPVVDEALIAASIELKDIGAIAVTEGPGLVGSILIGLSFAKAVSYVKKIPFTGVNHIEAHPFAAFLKDANDMEHSAPSFPYVSLIASGGHTTLLLHTSYAEYSILGQTLDDAAGEAFDKTAKLLGLGYPGGGRIDALSKEGDASVFRFTRPYLSKESLDFSFSGIKTAALHFIKGHGGALSDKFVRDLSASFQEAVVDVLLEKAIRAVHSCNVNDLVVAGGVACNSRLRERIKERGESEGIKVFIPPARYCSDNGAVIAAVGYQQIMKGVFGALDTNARPTWEGF